MLVWVPCCCISAFNQTVSPWLKWAALSGLKSKLFLSLESQGDFVRTSLLQSLCSLSFVLLSVSKFVSWVYSLWCIHSDSDCLYNLHCLLLICRLTPYEWYNPHPCLKGRCSLLINQYSLGNSFWFPVGGFMQQGSTIAPRALSTRCVSGVWLVLTVIFSIWIHHMKCI